MKRLQAKSSAKTKDATFASPPKVAAKHDITPLKTRSKASKCGKGEDVHTQSTPPVTPRSKLSRSKNSSPRGSNLANMYYLGVCSQELPEVIWDYNSGNLNEGIGPGVRSLTISDLLTNHQMPGNAAAASGSATEVRPSRSYVNMIEKWMEFRKKSPASHRATPRYPPRKRRTRHVVEELEAVFKSGDKMETSCAAVLEEENGMTSDEEVTEKAQRAFQEESSTTNVLDEENEFWGEDADDDLLIKASQEVESMLANGMIRAKSQLTEALGSVSKSPCTIIENGNHVESTMATVTGYGNNHLEQASGNSDGIPVASQVNDSKFLEMDDSDWDLELNEDDEWADALLLETCGESESNLQLSCNTISKHEPVVCTSFQTAEASSLPSVTSTKDNSEQKSPKNQDAPSSEKMECKNNEKTCRASEDLDLSTFSDELFSDDSDALNWDNQINDETADFAAEVSPKCTPVEIAQKKELAMRRLRLKGMK